MPKSSARGARTSAEVEVLGVTRHAVWLLVGDREFMLPFAAFPWFGAARVDEICDVKLLHGRHLHWPKLDVDLDLESIEHPERFPLLSRVKRREPRSAGTGHRRGIAPIKRRR